MQSILKDYRHLPAFREESPNLSSDGEEQDYVTNNGRAVSWHARKVDDAVSLPYDWRRSKSLHVIRQLEPEHWNGRYLARTSVANPMNITTSRYRTITATQRSRKRRIGSIQLENNRLLGRNASVQLQHRDVESAASNYSRPDSSISDDYSSSDSSIRLEEHIKLHHLQKLLQIFKSHTPQNARANVVEKGIKPVRPPIDDDDEGVRQAPGMMTLQEFTATISGMLGTTRWNDQMEMLFHKVDTACDGYVDWNEFCTYMLLQMREVEHIQKLNPIPFTSAAIVKQIFHNKQETTTKCIVVENPSRILTISKVGAIGVWDLELRLLKTYNLANDVSDDQQQGPRRRFHTWITDVVYMRNNQKVVLTTSSREIYFYDVSTSIYTIEFCLYAIPNVPICAHYWYNKSARNSHSMLLFGDDTGAAHILHFYTPQSRLFQKPFSPQQGTQRVYFNELSEHQNYVSYECIGNIHDDVVRRIIYVPQSDVIISSSTSPNTSLVLMDVKRKKRPYIFKLSKGVECFDFSKALNILVTGSLDHLVRIWNPYVVARPITILQGHSTGICDVVINEAYGQIVTYSKDVIIKVWDIKEHHCLQTISPKFPSLQPGRIPDHGEFPLNLYASPHDLMMVTCNDSVALLKMGKLEPKAEEPTTHDAPLCSAIYNPLFHQVVSGSDNSVVSVWDVETGARSLTFSNAHEQEEITCLSFDNTRRRLFTGARDGTIKVWNFQNGNCLHELEAVDDAEISGIMSFQDRTILAVGWSRKLAVYDDSDPDTVNVPAKVNWKSGQLHEDDILTASHCPPNLLATGSYDGCIYVWNEETQQVYLKLREGRQHHNGETIQPIDMLFFLTDRARHPKRNRATLISSESGCLYWWCLFGRNTLLGRYQATSDEASVLAICSTSDDSYLITGDTIGYVSVWDIEHYCTTDQEQESEHETPSRFYHWKAHEGAVVSVNFIDHEIQSMIVTASVDKTARLWTLEGRLIGTFGQKKKWNLKKPTSYQYPKDPWGEIVSVPEAGHAQKVKEVLEVSSTENPTVAAPLVADDLSPEGEVIPQISDSENLEKSNKIEPDLDEENLVDEKNKHASYQENDKGSNTTEAMKESELTNEVADSDNDVIGNLHMPNELSSRLVERRMTSQPADAPKMHERYRENRSMTIAGIERTKKGNILGDRAEQHLTRKTATRQQRRYRVGYIDKKTTSRFGNLCSPFQALTIKDTDAVSFANEMPMTKRMLEKGMRCRDEIELSKMPLNHLAEMNEESNKTHHKRRHNAPRRSTLLPPIGASSSVSASTASGH